VGEHLIAVVIVPSKCKASTSSSSTGPTRPIVCFQQPDTITHVSGTRKALLLIPCSQDCQLTKEATETLSPESLVPGQFGMERFQGFRRSGPGTGLHGSSLDRLTCLCKPHQTHLRDHASRGMGFSRLPTLLPGRALWKPQFTAWTMTTALARCVARLRT
jgi:hypothetical protein